MPLPLEWLPLRVGEGVGDGTTFGAPLDTLFVKSVGSGVTVSVGVAVASGVLVAVPVGVLVGVFVGVLVNVLVGVFVGVFVGVAVLGSKSAPLFWVARMFAVNG